MRVLYLFLPVALTLPAAADEFASEVRPVLIEHCAACHNPDDPKQQVDFLQATSATEVASRRGLWSDVAVQLRNRTMPPIDSRLAEEDRFRIATWIQSELRETACDLGEFAGAVTLRRLNRREYRNTVRDLLGVDFEVSELFPADGSGGEGFDTNGETLFVPELLMERYLEAAQQILNRAVITPAYVRRIDGGDLQPPVQLGPDELRVLSPGEEVSGSYSVYADGMYDAVVSLRRPTEAPIVIAVKVDGIEAQRFTLAVDTNDAPSSRTAKVRLARGSHVISVEIPGDADQPARLLSLRLQQQEQKPSPEIRAVHQRLLGFEPGDSPLRQRPAARRFLTKFLRKAFRRPVEAAEVDRFLALYDRAAERGDPYEERVKLALKAVMVSPQFLFRIEQPKADAGLHLLSDHELASRLSYFLWSTMPDAELDALADAGRLSAPDVLADQVERMLDDPRSRSFSKAFIGQWLGTKDIGGRVAPTVNSVQHFYTPAVAADMRSEPVLMWHYLLDENRSLLEFLDSDYTFMTQRLAKFYQVEREIQVEGEGFRRVHWKDARRGGVLGLGAVLAMTSHFERNSPVLRGAWVLETLLGTPVPSPPPDIPPLETGDNDESGLSERQKLTKHREDPACAACHNLIDPIGFGLENFDWLGRWRDHAENGEPVDAKGVMPSGESFDGPAELRKVLLGKKEEFLRHVSGKVLGYALGRSLLDADQCLVQQLVEKLENDGYKMRTLIREIVLSTPFRYRQGEADMVASAE